MANLVLNTRKKQIEYLKQAYKGQGYEKITEDQIELLNQIGMKWFSENIDMKLQKKK